MKPLLNSIAGRWLPALAGLILLSHCASSSRYTGPVQGDTNRDGSISEAEYSAEIARIKSEIDASHARTRKSLGLDP